MRRVRRRSCRCRRSRVARIRRRSWSRVVYHGPGRLATLTRGARSAGPSGLAAGPAGEVGEGAAVAGVLLRADLPDRLAVDADRVLDLELLVQVPEDRVAASG